MLRTILAATVTGLVILAPPAAAYAAPDSPVIPGGYCAANETGQVRQAPGGHWYGCAQAAGTRRWYPVASATGGPTDLDGYGPGSPGPSCPATYGAGSCSPSPSPSTHPTPSPTRSGSPAPTLPQTGPPTVLLIVIGLLITAAGAALVWVRRTQVTPSTGRHSYVRKEPRHGGSSAVGTTVGTTVTE